jgi:hypothetical protein
VPRKQPEAGNKLHVGKDLEGSGCGIIDVLSQHLSEGPEETHEIPQSGILY